MFRFWLRASGSNKHIRASVLVKFKRPCRSSLCVSYKCSARVRTTQHRIIVIYDRCIYIVYYNALMCFNILASVWLAFTQCETGVCLWVQWYCINGIISGPHHVSYSILYVTNAASYWCMASNKDIFARIIWLKTLIPMCVYVFTIHVSSWISNKGTLTTCMIYILCMMRMCNSLCIS